MLRKKEPKTIVTFHTTADAIAVERICKDEKVPGRMIPVPRELSSGCGLAYCAPAEARTQIEILLKRLSLDWEQIEDLLY